MKKQFLFLLCIFFSIHAFAQKTLDDYVDEGIKLHDEGKYTQAIEKYKKALEFDKKSPLVHYELSLTYMMGKDYNNAIKHADIVIKQKSKHLLPAYINKGSCLDNLGYSKKAIKVYQKGLKKAGESYLLHYNMALTFYRMKDLKEAEKSAQRAINLKASHSSSHFVLGYVMYEQNQRIQSLLSLYHALLLEPNTSRAKSAMKLLQEQFYGNVKKTGETEFNISIDASALKSDFSAADLSLSMLVAANNTEKNIDKSKSQLFQDNTTSLFNILGELKEENSKGLWWNYYVPMFNEFGKSDHMETFCHYISLSASDESKKWLEDNEDKVKAFAAWIAGNETDTE